MAFSPVTNPALPFVGAIPGGLQPGRMIRVLGVPQPSARCFSINLQTGPGSYSQDDIGLHLSPVFTPPPRLVRNSLQSQQWGPEESHGPYFPFVAGQQFEILILTESDEFKIAVNGQHFCEFRHRIPFQRITSLAVNGDVTISQIVYEGVTSQPGTGASPAGFAGGFCAPSAGAPPAISIPPPAPAYAHPGQQPYPTQPGVPYQGSPYGAPPPPPGGSPYGVPPVPPGGSPYGMPPHQAYQSGYPGAYPHSSKQSGGLGGLLPSGLAAGLGALAGSALLGKGVGGRSGHGHKGHDSSLASSALAVGVDLLADTAASSLAAANHPYGKPKSSSPIPIGLAAGAGALAGAAMLGKSPLKMGKKMKKLYKHKGFKHKGFKHKGWHMGGWRSSSSSSSSEEE